MIMIKVWGVPATGLVATQGSTEPGDPQVILGKCSDGLRDLVASVPPLSTGRDDVFVFFPSDLLQAGLGEELIVELAGNFAQMPGSRHEHSPMRVLDLIIESVRVNLAVRIPQCKEVLGTMTMPISMQAAPIVQRRPHAQRDWSRLVDPS